MKIFTYINKTKKVKNQTKIFWIWLRQADEPKTQSHYLELHMFSAEEYMAVSPVKEDQVVNPGAGLLIIHKPELSSHSLVRLQLHLSKMKLL